METQLASLETLNNTCLQIFKLSELLCELQNTRSSRPNEDVVTTIELVIKPSLSSMYTTFGSLQVSAQRPTSFLYMVLLMQCLYCVYIRKIQRSLRKGVGAVNYFWYDCNATLASSMQLVFVLRVASVFDALVKSRFIPCSCSLFVFENSSAEIRIVKVVALPFH